MAVLQVKYDGSIVALSAGMAFIGCYAVVSLMEQYRLSLLSSGRTPLLLMAPSSIALGGVAIWSLHMVASCSFELSLNGTSFPVQFNLGMIIIALVVNVIIQFTSIYIVSKDGCFNKSKQQIMDLFISRASSAFTMAQIKKMGAVKLLALLLTHNPWRVIFGGVFSGFGAALVIYLGLMSMEFQGHVQYNPGLVVLTTLLSALFATNGFFAFIRILSVFPSRDSIRIGVAVNSLFFMTGMHYIGLSSATFIYDPTSKAPSLVNTVSREQLLVGTVVAAVLYCLAIQLVVTSDLRAWLLDTSTQLRQANIVIEALHRQLQKSQHEQQSAAHRELVRYLRRYNQRDSRLTASNSDRETSVSGELSPYKRSAQLFNDYEEEEEALISDNNNGELSNSVRPKVRSIRAPYGHTATHGNVQVSQQQGAYIRTDYDQLEGDIDMGVVAL